MKKINIEPDVRAAIKEFVGLFEELTTSDLQGVIDARAIMILRKYHGEASPAEAMDLSERILSGTYAVISNQGVNYGHLDA